MTALEKMKSDLNKLKFFLIVITVLELVVVFGAIWNSPPFINEILSYNQILGVFAFCHFFGIALFSWYIWKKHPVKKSKKRNDILMILFLGIIGMWLWMPNKTQLSKILES
jgi:hypothetical protein